MDLADHKEYLKTTIHGVSSGGMAESPLAWLFLRSFLSTILIRLPT
jgi:hypothetical protein